MIDVHHEYYMSDAYREAVDASCKDASHDGNPNAKFPNLPMNEWDKRFVAALLERGLVLKVLNSGWQEGKPFPLNAPTPYSNGYPWPSYIVKVAL